MKRAKSIKIRVTAEEYERLKTLCGPRGLSALLRNRALRLDRRQERIDRLGAVAELARTRTVLNQIARASERQPLPEQIEIVSQLIAIERQLGRIRIP